MNFGALENNLIDALLEQQLKLGYMEGAVGFYYPKDSVNTLLGTEIEDNDKLNLVLLDFIEYTKDRLGKVEVSHKKDRFCFLIPSQGAAYVHENINPGEFLPKFLELVSRHGVTLDEVYDFLKGVSDSAVVEVMQDEDFDAVAYFKDGKPDKYYYCLTDEAHHVIYHRYTKEDFERIMKL